jgi:hypothetical protein
VRAPPSPTAPGRVRPHQVLAERGVAVCRGLSEISLTGTVPTELGTMDALTYLCVRRPRPRRLDACAIIRFWLSAAWYRDLPRNSLTGPLPTELGTMDALGELCVRRPHPPRLGACAGTRLGCGLS